MTPTPQVVEVQDEQDATSKIFAEIPPLTINGREYKLRFHPADHAWMMMHMGLRMDQVKFDAFLQPSEDATPEQKHELDMLNADAFFRNFYVALRVLCAMTANNGQHGKRTPEQMLDYLGEHIAADQMAVVILHVTRALYDATPLLSKKK
jgi:hypothetical protein